MNDNHLSQNANGTSPNVPGTIFSFFRNAKVRARDVVLWYAEHKHAGRALGFFAFIESIFFPIPPDVFLIALVGGSARARWWYYASVTTAWSVLGGIVGYAIGMFLYDTVGVRLINFYGLSAHIAYAENLLSQHEFIAIFLAGFTPIPYKVFTLGAGFLSVGFATFVIASIVSRGMRFFAVAYIMKVFGREMGAFVFKYFNILTILVAVLAIFFVLSF